MRQQSPELPPAIAASELPTRRQFLRRAVGGAAATAGGAFLYTWRIEPHWVEVIHRSLPINGLPAAMAGKRLVQLSDLHAGPIVDQSFLLNSVEGVARLRPDLIVVTGDFMTCRRDEEIPRALDVMRALPSAPLGRLAILGNHDYGKGWRGKDVADALARGLEKLDLNVLRNDVTDVGGLQFAGVDDFYSSNFRPADMLTKLDASRPAVALCHNPDAVDQAAWRDFRGWVLAGHTHGGQCRAPFCEPPLLPVRNRTYVAGEYDLGDGRRMYINRGLGYLHRVRFNCRPEITVFTLEEGAA